MVNYIHNTTTAITEVIGTDGTRIGVYRSDASQGAFVGTAADGTRHTEQTRRNMRRWFEDRDRAARGVE